MKIVILSNNDEGLYRFRREIVSKLAENNEVYLSLPKGDFTSKFVEMNCQVIETSIARHGTNPIQDLKLYKFYRKTLKSIKPDIVLTYTIKPNIYGGMACSSLKIPYVANITGLGNAIENSGLIQKITLPLYKRGLKKARMVFFQNSSDAKFMIDHKIVKSECDILPGSGVNLDANKFEEYPEDSSNLTFVTIGRVLKDKGIDELLSAISILKKEYNNLTFRIIGPMDGNYKDVLKEAEDNNLIEYLGHRNDIHDLIKASNATIHPSYHEGTSNVLLETAACGRPILASNVPGCNNTFDEKSGIAFEPKNVESLVEAIKKFISLTYEEKKEMGYNGRKKVEREFDRNIVIGKYMSIIDTVKKEHEKSETI